MILLLQLLNSRISKIVGPLHFPCMHLFLEGNGRLSCQVPCAADDLWFGRQEPGEDTG